MPQLCELGNRKPQTGVSGLENAGSQQDLHRAVTLERFAYGQRTVATVTFPIIPAVTGRRTVTPQLLRQHATARNYM